MIAIRQNFDRRWLWSLAFGTIVGASAFALLLAWAGVDTVWSRTAEIRLRYLFVYLGLTVGTYLLRAWRFHLLIGSSGIIAKLYGVVAIHNLMVNLLPFSGGELSYPFLLKYCGISLRFSEGLPSLIVARFQDMLLSGFLLAAALFCLGQLSAPYVEKLLTIVLLGLLAVGIVVMICRTPARKLVFVRKMRPALLELFSSLREIDRGIWLRSFAIALIGRSTSIVATFYLMQAVGLSLSFATVFLICSAYVFLPLLPLNTVAGIGVTEAVLVAFFVGAGLDEKTAVAASIQIHALQLIVAIALGLLGTLYLHCNAREKEREVFA